MLFGVLRRALRVQPALRPAVQPAVQLEPLDVFFFFFLLRSAVRSAGRPNCLPQGWGTRFDLMLCTAFCLRRDSVLELRLFSHGLMCLPDSKRDEAPLRGSVATKKENLKTYRFQSRKLSVFFFIFFALRRTRPLA